MNDILNNSMVLVLNRNWQAVNVRTPQEAFCMMATDAAALMADLGEYTGGGGSLPEKVRIETSPDPEHFLSLLSSRSNSK